MEDEEAFAARFARNVPEAEFVITRAHHGLEALDRLREQFIDLVVTDVRMPHLDGLQLIERVRSGTEPDLDPDVPFVVLSSVDDLATAVEAMRLGAADYITKDAPRAELLLRLRRALERSRMINENRQLRDLMERRTRSEFGDIIGESEPLRALKAEMALIAPHAQRVLITGETGVGKELVARAIHMLGPQAGGPFVDVNCAALPDENMLLSELFGHEKGAFTGATQQHKGRFEQSDGGTLFLDEIGELPLGAQARLLKAIENRRFQRLGSNRTIEVHCRVVAATNRDLEAEVRAGRFREDLYYRLNVVQLRLPPLRERREDIPLLVSSFVRHCCREFGRPPMMIEPAVIERMQQGDWPGNIRELRNVVERLVMRSRGDVISAEALTAIGLMVQTESRRTPENARQHPAQPSANPTAIPDEGIDLEQWERDLVEAALIKAKWSQKEAARLLGISPDRLNARVKKFGFRHESWWRHR